MPTLEERVEKAERDIGEFLWLVKTLAPPAVKLESDILQLRSLTERGFAEVGVRLTRMEIDVGTLKADVSVLKEDVGALKADVREILRRLPPSS